MQKQTAVVKAIACFSKVRPSSPLRSNLTQRSPFHIMNPAANARPATRMQNNIDCLVVERAHQREPEMLIELTNQVDGKTIYAFGDKAARLIRGLIGHFRECLLDLQRGHAHGWDEGFATHHQYPLTLQGHIPTFSPPFYSSGPKVKRRIAEYCDAKGVVQFGGTLNRNTDFRLAALNNLGVNLVEERRA